MMTYNPRFYVSLVEGAGFRKAKDLLAYWFEIAREPLDRLQRLAGRFARSEPNIVIRNVSKSGLKRDLPKTIPLPPGRKKEDYTGGKPPGTFEEGTETVTIAGTRYKARWYKARFETGGNSGARVALALGRK